MSADSPRYSCNFRVLITEETQERETRYESVNRLQITVRLTLNLKRRTRVSILRTLRVATTGTPVDTLRALVEFVGSCSSISTIVKYGV